MNFGLIMRSYAPFPSFGGGFHGDNRGPSTASDVTSRIKAWVVFDPMTGKVGEPAAKSDESRHPLLSPKTGIPTVRVDAVHLGPGWLHFRLSYAGGNPLVPQRISPDIDNHLLFTASIGKGHLNINAELKGDQFPNSEVMVEDGVGTRRLIQSYETSGGRQTGPGTRLPGDRRAPMSAICISLPVDQGGRFL